MALIVELIIACCCINESNYRAGIAVNGHRRWTCSSINSSTIDSSGGGCGSSNDEDDDDD